MSKKPTLLIINDDGIHAPGLKALYKALKGVAHIRIVAPQVQQSGVGVSITLRTPLTVSQVEWEDETPAWSVSGTPADCVRMAINVLLSETPDLIVSGVNQGSNAGRNVLYSGTIGGVIDGIFRDIPGIAFSCEEFINPDYEVTKEPIEQIVSHILTAPLPKGTLLNVNFPKNHPGKGVKLTRQGKMYIKEGFSKGIHPEGSPYYWTGYSFTDFDEHQQSDIYWLERGYITASPLQVNELTDLLYLEQHQASFENLFTPSQL